MPPSQAEILYGELLAKARVGYDKVQSGVFAADMQIALENNGPVTFMLQS